MARVPNTFSGPTQLVAMALEGVDARRPLFALPPEPGLPRLFANAFPFPHFLYHDYAIYRRDTEVATGGPPGNATLSFAAASEVTDEPHDLAVIYLPKSREEIEFVFSSVSRVLGPGTRVLVVGAKRSGIRSSTPLMEKYFGTVGPARSARHSTLIEATRTVTAELAEGKHIHSVIALGHELQVVTLPGVFSYGRLDEGTEFLLNHLGTWPFETALDWGCGAGVIGAALKLAHPEGTVDLVDSNVMAVEATRLTLEANGLPTDCVRPSDVFSDVPGQYDLMVSNPPFHTGVGADFSVTERLIGEAGQHLTAAGRLVIVANTFIKYLPHFRRHFRSVRVLAEGRRYRVIEATNSGT